MNATLSSDTRTIAPPLLGPGEDAPYQIFNPDGKANCLLICDHASNAVPAKLGTLGLPTEELAKHASWDIGARDVTMGLAKLLDAPAVLASYSRMVIDLNRRLDHPTVFPTTSEGIPVPGNLNMAEADCALRIDEIYRPYHTKIEEILDGYIDRGIYPAIISIHSFTPRFYGQERPWEVSVLWVQDGRLPQPFMDGMTDKGYHVGDNEPYDARILRGATTHMHADGRLLPNLLVEYRNDLLQDDARREKIINDSYDVLKPVLADERLYTLYDGPQVPHDLELEHKYFEDVVRTAHRQGADTGKEDKNG